MINKSHLEGLIKKLEDPLFVLALIVSLVPILRFVLPVGSVYTLLPVGIALLGLVSVYFTYLSVKKSKNYFVVGIPLLIFCIAIFLHYSNIYDAGFARDYNVFSLCAGSLLFFYILSAYGMLKWNFAMVLVIFFTALITHMIPARATMIAEIDPYWFYKFGQGLYNTGHVPEYDSLVYPLWGGIKNPTGQNGGIDFSAFPFFNAVFMGVLGFALKPLNFTLLEAAILYPGVLSAFMVVLVYLLVVSLFSDKKPYNHIAGVLAAFMLMFSPAFSVKAIATNTEDDNLGMMLMIGTFFLFIESYRKKSLRLSLLAAFSFLLLTMTWAGFVYAVIVMSLFSAFYALVGYFKKESCIEHIPYLLLAVIPEPLLLPFVLHPRGALPQLSQFIPDKFYIVAVGGAVLFALLLEAIRIYKHGKIKAKEDDELGAIYNLIENNIYLFAFVIVIFVAGLIIYLGPKQIYDFIAWKIVYVRSPPYLIGRTIAEQNPTATSIGEFLAAGTNRFGLSLTFGLLMIIPLLYLGLVKRNVGAIFVLCWSLPMLYGSYHKSQLLFAASVPISVLGATVGLYSVAKIKDFETLRVIGAILVLSTPFVYVPFLGSWNYEKFVAYIPINMGVGADNYYWDPALQWLKNDTPENSGVITWWDYGHWITAVSHRHVVIDNLQADHYQIQDIARFFVNATDEDTAFETVKAYQDAYKKEGVDLRYVLIDWTMIGKGSALHYIATGNISPFTEGSWKNYAYCYFNARASDTSPKIVPNANGTISYVQDVVFACTNYVPGVSFRVQNNRISSVSVLDGYGGEIPWDSWVREHDASLLGLYPVGQIVGLAKDRPFDNILPTLRAFVYVPEEFNDFMMTRLYFGEYLDSYKALGLYNREVKPLKHFRQVNDFVYGFVRAYEIIDEPVSAPEIEAEPINLTAE